MQRQNENERVLSLKTQRLIASGGVIFRTSIKNQFEVALCFKSREKIWCLPKGLIEQGETAEKAAMREIKEETGLEGEIIKKIGQIEYHFFEKGKHYFKIVHFYLLKYSGGSLYVHDSEVEKVEWSPISKALQILAYANERKILRKAKNMLEKSLLA